MSLILDALNRSRNETGAVPDLDAVHAGTAGGDSGGQRGLLPWAGLALAVLVIAYLLLERSDPAGGEPAEPLPREPAGVVAADTTRVPAGPAAAAPRAAPPAPVVAQAAAPEPAGPAPVTEAARPAEVDAVAQAEDTPDPDVAALYAGQPGASGQAAPAQRSADPTAAAAGTRDAAEPASAGKPAPVPELPAAAQEQAVDIEAMIRQAEDALENARLAEHPAPFIAALSQQVKDDIPTLLYERHEYSGNPSQSRVVLNGQSLAAGATTRGVRVEEILPDSVVLRYRDTQFRLRALNSWVNL